MTIPERMIQVQYRKDHRPTKSVVDYFCERERNPREGKTKFLDLQKGLRRAATPLSLEEIRDVLQDFQDAGWGKIVNGKDKRFVWSVGAREKCLEIAGDGDDASVATDTSDDSAELPHVFPLRADYKFSFSLPANITAIEAKRLGEFIGSLALDRTE